MKTALALVLCVLVLLGGVSYIEWQLHEAESAAATANTDLKAAKEANQSQALALATLKADRAADQQQLAALTDQLTLIEAQRNTERSTFDQVVVHATPADKNLLASKLPAATLQLFPRSTVTVDPNASHPPVHP